MPGERGADGHAGSADLVFGLQRADTEVLVPRELVEDVRRRRDRVRRVGDRELAALRGGDQAVGEGDVAGDVAIAPRRQVGRQDLPRVVEQLGGLAERVPGLEGGGVRVRHLGSLREALGDPLQRRLDRARVHPGHEAQREGSQEADRQALSPTP